MNKALWAAIFVLFVVNSLISPAAAEQTGFAETTATWMTKERETVLLQTLGWRGHPFQLPIDLDFEIQVRRDSSASLSLEQGELVCGVSNYEIRGFTNMGFASTLDPLRLLAASRRAEDFFGLEFKGSLKNVGMRGLWMNEVANVGDDGSLLLLDLSLEPAVVWGDYRYLYITHSSDWHWHHPKSGSYATKTEREIHALVARWNATKRVQLLGEVAHLSGLDVHKTYKQELTGLTALVRGEISLNSGFCVIDLHKTAPGFVLATGDENSPKAGHEGVSLQIGSQPRGASAWKVKLDYHRPSRESADSSKSSLGYRIDPKDYTVGEITYRRRFDEFSHGVGAEYKVIGSDKIPKVFWEGNWRPFQLQLGGQWKGGTAGSWGVYGKMAPHPKINLGVRRDVTKDWWRTNLTFTQDAGESVWQCEAVYKKRPEQHYTYLALQHKMDKGYWEIRWGKSDHGHLEWAWNAPQQISISWGRYF